MTTTTKTATNDRQAEIAKMLEAKKEIDVLYHKERVEWYFNGKRTNKRNAAAILKKYGLTLTTYMAARKAWVDGKIEKSIEEMKRTGEWQIYNLG